MLQRLGAKAEKGPRMPAFMGKGIAAARQTREARQLEEAMQAGMVKRKGFSKKKKLDHGEALMFACVTVCHRGVVRRMTRVPPVLPQSGRATGG